MTMPVGVAMAIVHRNRNRMPDSAIDGMSPAQGRRAQGIGRRGRGEERHHLRRAAVVWSRRTGQAVIAIDGVACFSPWESSPERRTKTDDDGSRQAQPRPRMTKL